MSFLDIKDEVKNATQNSIKKFEEKIKDEQKKIDKEVDKLLSGAENAYNEAKDGILEELDNAIFAGLCKKNELTRDVQIKLKDSYMNLAKISSEGTSELLDKLAKDDNFEVGNIVTTLQSTKEAITANVMNKINQATYESEKIEKEVRNIILAELNSKKNNIEKLSEVKDKINDVIETVEKVSEAIIETDDDIDKALSDISEKKDKALENLDSLKDEFSTYIDKVKEPLLESLGTDSNSNFYTISNNLANENNSIKSLISNVVESANNKIFDDIVDMLLVSIPDKKAIPDTIKNLDRKALAMIPNAVIKSVMGFLGSKGLLRNKFHSVENGSKDYDGEKSHTYTSLQMITENSETINIGQLIDGKSPEYKIVTDKIETKNALKIVTKTEYKDNLYVVIGDREFKIGSSEQYV